MKNLPACSIIIRAYNESEHITRLLDGIDSQHMKELEVILVDSGSSDSTVAIAESYRQRFPVKVVRISPEEFTFGRSLNHGIAVAEADLVVIASAHVYPIYPDWIEQLLAPFADQKVALSYGKQRGNHTSNFSEQQVFKHWYPDGKTGEQSHPFCNNANAAIRRSIWEEHPYDESLSGLEDIAWANWVIDQGYRIVYSPEAEIVHLHKETPGAVYNRYRREAMAFNRIFPNEDFTLWDFIRLVSTNIASDLRQAAVERGLIKHLTSILTFRLMQFWGTYRGYRQSGPLTWQLRRTFYYPRASASAPDDRRPVGPIQYN